MIDSIEKFSDGGTVNLLSRSYGVYNINELGLQKCTSRSVDETDHSEKTYKCCSHEMRIFGAIGSGASSVVQRAIHIPTHRILALKKINIFEKVFFRAPFVAFHYKFTCLKILISISCGVGLRLSMLLVILCKNLIRMHALCKGLKVF